MRVDELMHSTAGAGKRVRSTSLYHFKHCCDVFKPHSDCTDYTVVCFMTQLWQVIWAKLTWRSIAAVLPLWQAV